MYESVFMVVLWIYLSFTAGLYARRLGRIWGGYAILGLLFSPLAAYATIFSLGQKPLDDSDDKKEDDFSIGLIVAFALVCLAVWLSTR